jgi:hypothetical protein
VLVAALGAVGGFGYYRYAVSKLPAQKGVVTAGVCKPTPSLSGSTLPLTFEAFVKSEDDHNWLASGRSGTGLVAARFEWSHGGQSWAEDADFAARQAEDVKKRQKLASGSSIQELLSKLRSEDEAEREIAARELKIRTRGETFGYRYDAPKEEREKAAKAWDEWWAKPETQFMYGARKVLDTFEKLSK